jgi:hypothetical protein
MPFISSFYGPDDPAQPLAVIFYHNNSACSSGSRVPGPDRRASTGGHRLCDQCEQLNKSGR